MKIETDFFSDLFNKCIDIQGPFKKSYWGPDYHAFFYNVWASCIEGHDIQAGKNRDALLIANEQKDDLAVIMSEILKNE